MKDQNYVAMVLDTVLASPGMKDTVKIDLKISRKNVLLLNHVITHGLASNGDDQSNAFLASIPEESKQELKAVADECLQKADLVEFSEKLSAIGNEKK